MPSASGTRFLMLTDLRSAREREGARGSASARGAHTSDEAEQRVKARRGEARRGEARRGQTCSLGEEALVEHQQRVDRLVHTRRADGVAGERLGGADVGRVAGLDEPVLDGLELGEISHLREGDGRRERATEGVRSSARSPTGVEVPCVLT